MTTPDIPLLDISVWRTGSADERTAFAARLDKALQDSGFLLIEGHGIAPELLESIRAEAREFFSMAHDAKLKYDTPVGGRGWLRVGAEANAFYGETADVTKADLKESLTFGRDFTTGDAEVDELWFEPNVWPSEQPALKDACATYIEQARELYYDLLDVFSTALGLPIDWFRSRAQKSPQTFNLNRYPALSVVGAPQEGQFRVAPHTDWGFLTILDRQPGYGGLQVETLDGEWVDAPYVPGAFTINVADLLARWTGDHWRSTRHRVLPPQADAPDEELISIVLFLEADVDSIVEPLREGSGYEPVVYGEYLLQRTLAAAVP